jgi:hypothetical protein
MAKVALFVILVIIFVFTGAVWAEHPGRVAKYKHADKNNDGVVDRKEMKIEKKWEHLQKVKVNTPLEKKYDANGDGIIEPAEAKQMLIDRHALITKYGKAKVDSPIEALYDTDKDGFIDGKEYKAFMEEIK